MKKLLVHILILICIGSASAQETKQLFLSDSILKITIKLSLEAAITDLQERNYHEAKLSYQLPDGNLSNHKIKLKIRGNNRAKTTTCKFPPLELNFKKTKTDSTLYEGQNKLKLVTHCNDRKHAEQYVLKEYLTYKLYQLVSPYSFNVRLCEITYEDTEKESEPFTRFGFMIEHISDVAARNGMIVYKDSILNQEVCKRPELDRLMLFQYMIGNLDWSIPNRHNTKLIVKKEEGPPIAIPYDFDFAGIVGVPYAVPPEDIDIPSVKTRVFRGLCRFNNGYDPTFLFYQNLKPDIYKTINEASYLTEQSKNTTIKYIDGFYKVLDNPNQVNQKIVRACRAEHKHLYKYE